MKALSLYTYMILSLSILILYNVYQDIFTLRIIETVLISISSAVLLDGLIIWKKERKFRFPGGALISGLIIAAIIEPDLENQFIYLIPPTVAILSKHLIRVSNRNIFNPAAFGLLTTTLLFQDGITWWATNPIYLVAPLGLFIVYKMNGWPLILSFMLVSAPLYLIYGMINRIYFIDSLGLINYFFVLFMLTEHKSAPLTKKAKVIYGSLVGVLSFVFHFSLPQVDNTLLAIIIGNSSAPIINKWVMPGHSHKNADSTNG
jgi:Na+-transporting NADH:ubiquinone oxidoreductase subunit NqrB